MNWKLKAKICERFGSQADFAQTLKVHESEVSRVVRGRRELGPDSRRIWVDALGEDEKTIFEEGA